MEKMKRLELKELFLNLLSILEKYGDQSNLSQRRIVRQILELIETNDENDDLISIIRSEYLKLYPPHGSLSEFNIWSESYEERQALNEPLDTIRDKLGKIFSE